MKKIFTLLAFVLLSANVFAQAPQKMSYQAVIRNSSNDLVASTSIGMKISIVQGSDLGTVVFSETQSITTNNNGLATLEIGNGSVLEGTFGDIDWSQGPYFIKTETDPTGGTNYSITGTSELMSVPYALFALNSTPGPQGEPGIQGEPGLTGATGSVANVGTISEASTANGATVTAGELKLAPADATNGGIVTSGSQTFAGEKIFSGGLKVENKPFLPTKLNQSQINSLSALEEGMVVYNTDTRKLQLYSVGASDAINDSFTGTFTSDFLLDMEQTFIPPTTGVITAIQLFVKSDMDPELSLDIDFSDDSGTGLGSASDYIPFANPGSAEWINLSVSNIAVLAGQTYKFSVDNMMSRAMYGTNSNYFNGSLIAGCCGEANGDDLMFKILITPTNGTTAYWLNLN